MVVCSRVKDYEALTERLRLSSAICIQPLSQKQVYSFLAKAGDSLTGLKTLLQQEQELEQFAQTPLILNIMSLAYQGWSAEDLLQQFSSTKDRYQHLFDNYIKRMLHRRVIGQLEPNKNSAKYPQEKVLHRLSWLANMMVKQSKTIFLIEKLQSTLLQSSIERINYRISNFLLGGLIFGLILLLYFAVFPGRDVGNVGKLVWPIIFALIGGVIAGLSQEITLFEQMSWSWQKAKYRIINEVFLGIVVGMISGLITLRIFKVLKPDMNPEWYKVMIFGVMGGLIFGLNSGLKSTEVQRRTFPNQGIRSSFQNSLKIGLIGGLIIGGIAGLIVGLKMKIFSMLYGLDFGLIGGLILWIRNGGTTCIQHFNLRRILYRKGRIPWNYARFLDYASERLLMKKVGGGYIFYHRMLMEHFAQRDRVSRESVPVTPRQTSQPVAKANKRTKVRSSNISNTLPQTDNPVQKHLICSNCNHQNPNTGKFCIKCGQQLINQA